MRPYFPQSASESVLQHTQCLTPTSSITAITTITHTCARPLSALSQKQKRNPYAVCNFNDNAIQIQNSTVPASTENVEKLATSNAAVEHHPVHLTESAKTGTLLEVKKEGITYPIINKQKKKLNEKSNHQSTISKTYPLTVKNCSNIKHNSGNSSCINGNPKNNSMINNVSTNMMRNNYDEKSVASNNSQFQYNNQMNKSQRLEYSQQQNNKYISSSAKLTASQKLTTTPVVSQPLATMSSSSPQRKVTAAPVPVSQLNKIPTRTLTAVGQKLELAKHTCTLCGKSFKRAHNLKIHGRLHNDDRPYGCPFEGCNKEFRWKSSIVSHINWHRTKKGQTLPASLLSPSARSKPTNERENSLVPLSLSNGQKSSTNSQQQQKPKKKLKQSKKQVKIKKASPTRRKKQTDLNESKAKNVKKLSSSTACSNDLPSLQEQYHHKKVKHEQEYMQHEEDFKYEVTESNKNALKTFDNLYFDVKIEDELFKDDKLVDHLLGREGVKSMVYTDDDEDYDATHVIKNERDIDRFFVEVDEHHKEKEEEIEEEKEEEKINQGNTNDDDMDILDNLMEGIIDSDEDPKGIGKMQRTQGDCNNGQIKKEEIVGESNLCSGFVSDLPLFWFSSIGDVDDEQIEETNFDFDKKVDNEDRCSRDNLLEWLIDVDDMDLSDDGTVPSS